MIKNTESSDPNELFTADCFDVFKKIQMMAVWDHLAVVIAALHHRKKHTIRTLKRKRGMREEQNFFEDSALYHR